MIETQNGSFSFNLSAKVVSGKLGGCNPLSFLKAGQVIVSFSEITFLLTIVLHDTMCKIDGNFLSMKHNLLYCSLQHILQDVTRIGYT